MNSAENKSEKRFSSKVENVFFVPDTKNKPLVTAVYYKAAKRLITFFLLERIPILPVCNGQR